MIAIEQQTLCKVCGTPIVQKGGKGHRTRIFCSGRCKQTDYRRTHHGVTTDVTIEDKKQQRIAKLERELAEANVMIEHLLNKKQTKQPLKRLYQERLNGWGEKLGWPALDIHYVVKPGRKNWRVFMMDESNTLLIRAIIAAERVEERNRNQS